MQAAIWSLTGTQSEIRKWDTTENRNRCQIEHTDSKRPRWPSAEVAQCKARPLPENVWFQFSISVTQIAKCVTLNQVKMEPVQHSQALGVHIKEDCSHAFLSIHLHVVGGYLSPWPPVCSSEAFSYFLPPILTNIWIISEHHHRGSLKSPLSGF